MEQEPTGAPMVRDGIWRVGKSNARLVRKDGDFSVTFRNEAGGNETSRGARIATAIALASMIGLGGCGMFSGGSAVPWHHSGIDNSTKSTLPVFLIATKWAADVHGRAVVKLTPG